ncbi:MAG: hypothetical protein AB8G99_17955 [Planctomycetaceae bacterium]
MASGVNVLALVKDSQRYVFLFDDNSHDELLRQIGESAADEELNFTWYDAAVLSQRVREMKDEGVSESDEIELSTLTVPNRLPELDW